MKLTKEQIQTRRKWADALQTSKQIKRRLYDEESHCCLGVYANSVCGIDNTILQKWSMLAELDWDIPDIDIMRQKAGLDIEGDVMFMKLNDGFTTSYSNKMVPAMSHADIGLYLYFTCEAGEAFDHYLDGII